MPFQSKIREIPLIQVVLFEVSRSYVTIVPIKTKELSVLNSSEFDQIVDQTLIQIEDAIEDLDTDIDYDTVSGILTLEFADLSKIIINRQIATKQLWVAAKSGGFHFNYTAGLWQDERSAISLQQKLSELISLQAGQTLVVELNP